MKINEIDRYSILAVILLAAPIVSTIVTRYYLGAHLVISLLVATALVVGISFGVSLTEEPDEPTDDKDVIARRKRFRRQRVLALAFGPSLIVFATMFVIWLVAAIFTYLPTYVLVIAGLALVGAVLAFACFKLAQHRDKRKDVERRRASDLAREEREKNDLKAMENRKMRPIETFGLTDAMFTPRHVVPSRILADMLPWVLRKLDELAAAVWEKKKLYDAYMAVADTAKPDLTQYHAFRDAETEYLSAEVLAQQAGFRVPQISWENRVSAAQPQTQSSGESAQELMN